MKAIKPFCVLILVFAMLATSAACSQKQEETTAPTAAGPTTAVAPTTTKAPATTPAPTTEDESADMVDPFEASVDLLTTYYSIGENLGWEGAVYLIGDDFTGKQYVTFLATPLTDNVDGSIGFADFNKTVTGFSDLSMMVRMNAEGVFDVRNGDIFDKLADVAYEVDGQYFVEVDADMYAKTYTVYITPPQGERTMIAENYAFRTTANDTDDLGKVFFVSAGGNDEFTVDSFKRYYRYEPERAYYSTGHNFGWQQEMIILDKEYTGKIKIEYDHTSLIDIVDSSINFTDGSFDIYGFNDLAILIRMSINNLWIDARNGDDFDKLALIPVVKDTKYHVEAVVDLDAKTYSVWVTPGDGERIHLAQDFSFRTTANHADSIGQCVVISAHEDDSTKLENLTIVELE